MPVVVNAAGIAGLSAVIGAVATRFVVLGRSGLTVSERAPAARHAASGAMWGSAVVLLWAILRAADQVRDLMTPGDEPLGMLRLVIGSTAMGKAVAMQAIWAAVAMLAFASARRERERGWRAAALATTVLALTPGMLGHPAAAPQPTIALLAAALHVLGAGGWIGGLFHLWRASRVASDATLLRMFEAFHPLAFVSVSLLLLSGGYQVYTMLGDFAALTTTPWGKVLLSKLLFVTGVLALGYRHWRGAAAQVKSGGRAALRTSLSAELLLALVAIALTGMLTVTAPPD